jgi:hypothetical protein
VAKSLAALRIVYSVATVLIGSAVAVASAIGIWQGLQIEPIDVGGPFARYDVVTGSTTITNPYGFDGPPPLSFYNYGKAPAVAVIFLIIGFATLKSRWESLSLAAWFIMAPVLVDILASVFNFGWQSVMTLISVQAFWVYLPLVGIVVAAMSTANSRKTPAEAFLAVFVAAGYLWRMFAVAASPEADQAMGPLRGEHAFYPDSIEIVSVSIVGLGAAILLLIAAFTAWHGKGRSLNAAFAFTAGLSFPGFLQAIDLVFNLQASRNAEYLFHEALTFVTCAAVLAITVQRRRMTPSAAP